MHLLPVSINKNKHVLWEYVVSVFINVQADTLSANHKLSTADLLNMPIPKLECLIAGIL